MPTHWAAEFGGAEYQAQCLADATEETELFDITFLARETNPKFKSDQYKIYNIGSQVWLSRYAYFFDAYSLYKRLKIISPDIIYQRVGCSYTGIAARYARTTGADMIWHIAIDTDLMPFQGSFSPKSSFKYIEYLFLQYGIRNVPKIIAQTKYQDDLLFKNYNKRADAVVPNFHHDPVKNVPKLFPIKIVWVANLKPYKRPELYIKLAKELSYLENIKFIMIGKPQTKRSWIEALLDQVNKVDSIEYLPNASFHEVNEVLSKSHIFVNTSLYEGFPNTFIQSWMRCVPVVSLSINPDNVFNKENVGYCSGTFEQLIKDVKRLVVNNELRESMGENAKNYAMKTHSMRNTKVIIDLMS